MCVFLRHINEGLRRQRGKKDARDGIQTHARSLGYQEGMGSKAKIEGLNLFKGSYPFEMEKEVYREDIQI